MVVVNVIKTVEVPDQFILDCIIGPAGYDLRYWCDAADIDVEARTYTIFPQEDDGGVYVIPFDKLAQVLVDVAYDAKYADWDDWACWAAEAVNELENGEEFPGGTIDSELAGAIVQFAAFGELVYG